MKPFLFMLIAACVLVAACQAQTRHFLWGTPSWNSSLAFTLRVEKPSKFLRVVEERITFPPKGIINKRPIQAVLAFDQKNDNSGGYASIVGGGLNQTHVTVLLKSQRGKKLDFLLEVHTRY